MRRALLIGMLLVALAACGRRKDLVPAPGETAPPAPRGLSASPPVGELLSPPVQAAPNRVDDPLGRSEDRQQDRFDLPPPG